MDLRQGLNPFPKASNDNIKTQYQPIYESKSQTTEMTLCVTFGDAKLTSQFIQSLSNHAPTNIDIHIVACCFRISPEIIEDILDNHKCNLKSIEFYRSLGVMKQGEKGNIGPWYQHESQRNGVSWGRSVLHRAAAMYSPTNTMWILDDDVIFQHDSLSTLFINLMI